jgi:hypothetical protein
MSYLELCKFLLESKTTHSYANLEQVQKITMEDGGTELVYSKATMYYRDRYYGGEPYIGEEVVFIDNKAVWSMNYYGRVIDPTYDAGRIYAFLRIALKLMTLEMPFRGPKFYENDGLSYRFTADGGVECFEGREQIYSGNKLIYQGFVHGGLINLS